MDLQKEAYSQKPPLHLQMLLYQELLDYLDKERQALIGADEEAILSLASLKLLILERLQGLAETGATYQAQPEAPALADLKRLAAEAQRRNHALINASLEVIQDFLEQLQPKGAGTYGPPGLGASFALNPLFHRQA